MFTTRCFIKENTQYLCHKLEKLGYQQTIFYEGDLKYLIADEDINLGPYYCEANEGAPILFQSYIKYIDCGCNSELFLAIAALRDDSDYMQYITCAEDPQFTLCTKNSIDEFFNYEFPNELYRKATVEELIEHFKGI